MADPQSGQDERPDPARGHEPAPPRPSPGGPAKPPSVMRSLGEFFGHIGKAVRTPVTPTTRPGTEPPPSSAADTDAAPKAQDPPVSPVRRRVVSEIIEERQAEARPPDPREALAGDVGNPEPPRPGSQTDDPDVIPSPGAPKRVILRRTIVEEVEIRPDETPPEQRPT